MSYAKAKNVTGAPKPLTDEEKREQIARFFTQKRESFAQGILFNLCQNPNAIKTDEDKRLLVETSVKMADELIEKLYPVNQE